MNAARSQRQRNTNASLVRSAATAYSFRPFGLNREDLDFNFATDDRPRLVTEVLSACMTGKDSLAPDAEHVWNLPISQRIACLLRLATAGRDFAGRVTLHCPRNDCRQAIEMDLPIPETLALQQRAEEREFLEWRDGPELLRLRRPTGGDQLRWQRMSFADPAEARAAVCSSLIVDADAPDGESTGESPAGPRAPGLADALDPQLEDFDPLAAFSVRIRCPHCAVESDFQIDLEILALKELEEIQRQLTQDIHRLAAVYHWSEAEIFHLTPQRRGRYLRLIEEAAR